MSGIGDIVSFVARFNGAAPMKARKQRLGFVLLLDRLLQWGRADEGAETAAYLAIMDGHPGWLQWGRADEGAETALADATAQAEHLASMGPRR